MHTRKIPITELIKLAQGEIDTGSFEPTLRELQARYLNPGCSAEERAAIVEFDRTVIIPRFGHTRLPPAIIPVSKLRISATNNQTSVSTPEQRNEGTSAERTRLAIFNLLVSNIETAWETDQLMRMDVARFKELSSPEAERIDIKTLETLLVLEQIPTLLMYEDGVQGANSDVVRYGKLHDIRVNNGEVLFRFIEEGRFTRLDIKEFAERLGIRKSELNRTHWAIKDGSIPGDMLRQLKPTYDVVFSFAGEDRAYIEKVAHSLRSSGVRLFYDEYEELNLWGKDLADHFDLVYRTSGRYCVMFISKYYVEKMWTRHERKFALARALRERREYILPARFDDSEVPGIASTVGYVQLKDKKPEDLAAMILKKLGK